MVFHLFSIHRQENNLCCKTKKNILYEKSNKLPFRFIFYIKLAPFLSSLKFIVFHYYLNLLLVSIWMERPEYLIIIWETLLVYYSWKLERYMSIIYYFPFSCFRCAIYLWLHFEDFWGFNTTLKVNLDTKEVSMLRQNTEEENIIKGHY